MQVPKKYTNALINETSPYLLQHAHNPVEWYPWGEEAFAKAEREDKPVLVSIGYSACHWCHVMERESFEDEEIARLMNENFVNIKIDLEERPDIDKIYMAFVQLTTGQGGYPLNVFLTPEKVPFFGGTYFPPEPRFNMPSFPQVLESISEAWENRREELMNSAFEILGEVRRISIAEFPGEDVSPAQLETAFQSFERSFDRKNGGFGGAPKFPPAMALEFLLRYHKRTGNERALEMVRQTCTKMAHGGIFDQLGGGFHRYTVDAIWLTPHFEKMLYDNAQLAAVYLHLYQATGDEFYKRIAGETLEYVRREMLDEKGGFYSAQDADSEGVEGKYFVWSPEEVAEILGDERTTQAFNFFFDVSEDGNFEGKNILNVRNTLDETAAALQIEKKELVATLENAREKLFREREKRVKPFRDEKVLVAWNGLMLGAFAEAAAIFGRDDYLEIARRNADFILDNMRTPEGRLLRTWKDGEAKLNAYLEDYANLADGLIRLFEVSGETRYLGEARRLTELMISEFWDEEAGGFFFTSGDHEELLVRSKDFYDNATPSGNSAGADVLLKLAHLTGEENYRRLATSVLRLVGGQIRRFPQAFGRALATLEFYFSSVKEIVIIGEDRGELERVVWSRYLPDKVVVPAVDPTGEKTDLLPLLEGREKIGGRPTVYVCQNYTCQKPVTSAVELAEQLS